MSFTVQIRILNRLIENGVNLGTAYYGVFGDNMEVRILNSLFCSQVSSKKLKGAIYEAIKNNEAVA